MGYRQGVPSVEEFLRHYNRREYEQCLGLPPTPTREEVFDAADAFQMEHIDRQKEWGIALTRVKDQLLARSEPRPVEASPKPVETGSRPGVAPAPPRPVDIFTALKAKRLLASAHALYTTGNLRDAYETCSKIIELDPNYTQAYALRAWIGLLLPDYRETIDRVISDCTRVIQDEPDNANVHNDRGRAYGRIGDLENARINYRAALSLDPSMTIAALNLMEINICLGRYRDAIGTYGEWRPDVVEKKDTLIAEALLCIACALDGKEYQSHMHCLNDMRVTIRSMDDWCTDIVDAHLKSLHERGFDRRKLAQADQIHDLFKRHCR